MDACIARGDWTAAIAASSAVAAERQAYRSCTIAIEGKRRCVRDRGVYYSCEGGSTEADFTRSICEAYRNKTGAAAPAELCSAAAAGGGAELEAPAESE
jgi:hypothetical protein